MKANRKKKEAFEAITFDENVLEIGVVKFEASFFLLKEMIFLSKMLNEIVKSANLAYSE